MGASRHAGLSGIAVVVLFGAGNAIWALGMPPGGTPAAEVLEFYDERAVRIIAGASLSLIAIGAFVVFAAGVRQVLIDAGGEEFLATAAFGGALLGAAAGIGAEGINMIGGLRASEGELTADLARSVHEISQVLGSVAAAVGLGVFAVAAGWVAYGTGALPRRNAALALAGGVVLLTPLSYVNVVPGALMIGVTFVIALPLLRRAAP